MKKMKTGIGVMLALLCCILMCTGVVYANNLEKQILLRIQQ